jgi:hypothetical protein
MSGGGKSGSSGSARADEAARQAQIRAGTAQVNQTFDSQFTDDFYKGRRDAYTQYATPQLQQQYEDAQKELVYALSRQGLTDSSVRSAREAELTRLFNIRNQEVADKAADYEKSARSSVEDARTGIVSQLNSSANADQAARDAATRAVTLSQGDQYNPLTNLFSDFVGTLGKQAAQERAEARSGGAYRANFNTGLFAPRSGAVTTTGG